ncbi:hypothetical protein D1872_322500 [compost metagenome]
MERVRHLRQGNVLFEILVNVIVNFLQDRGLRQIRGPDCTLKRLQKLKQDFLQFADTEGQINLLK